MGHKTSSTRWAFTSLILTAVFLLGCKGWAHAQSKLFHSFKPGEPWIADDGVHINAHGGGILLHNGVYYWFGEHKTEGPRGNTAMIGVRCYASTDLYNWQNKGVALQTSDGPDSEIAHGCVIERPKVIFNPVSRKFIMWFHLELKGEGYKAARTAVAVADQVTGPYRYIRSQRINAGHWPENLPEAFHTPADTSNMKWWTPEWRIDVENGLFARRDFHSGQMSRDMTLFVDDDGKAYHIYASEENLTLHIAELTTDFLGFTGRYIRIFPGGHNEAPAIFKHEGRYYMITSGCTGWEPNAARSAVAPSIWGPWQELGNPCTGTGADRTFESQSTFVLPIDGSTGQFIFMADRWRPQNPIDGSYVWLPIAFENQRPVLKWYDEWDLSFFERKSK